MPEIPLTYIEKRAAPAADLHAFPINLMDIRSNIELILSEWKSSGLFYEYTDHSFKHVLGLLEFCEWLIPDSTKEIMTPADWMMLTLSCYFHDIGLLITKNEYNNRHSNEDFKFYLSNPQLSSDEQNEYEAKLDQIGPDKSDQLRYQDFVRLNHGKRVRSWIEGSAIPSSKFSASKVISSLLSPLSDEVKKDLAILCESHTVDRIDNCEVFNTSKPYGGPPETVNLQYIAAILRTADLLQITQNRAPSILYQLINPSDPLSQIEWKKQGAVRTVRAIPARDRDGAVTNSILPNAIEVHATFKEPDGFFGLTRYLSYAQKEIAATFSAVQKSHKDFLRPYEFPWRDIDTKEVRAEGFLTDSFEFELDQHKILDLLTGHTLYNNSTVVLRELTQNGLDAIRLQGEISGTSADANGILHISWNSSNRILTVTDNGTGMSQEIVENHLLKVGSSRYQDPKFKEKFPNFHSISRFGIGVLSAFMVSDDVEITTCSVDEDKARKIALRSVHGKYLIKLLDKDIDREELSIYPHGTSVKLKIRPTSNVGDVLKVASSWLMFPGCQVTVQIDGEPAVSIGYKDPKDALQQFVDASLKLGRGYKEYRVEQVEADGLVLAYALEKSRYFPDWGFVDASQSRTREDIRPALPVATCVEGVAVERTTPGFAEMAFLAVADARGASAPRTNVARSALEDTAEQRSMLSTIYRLYCAHVGKEIERLIQEESFSLTRAVSDGPYIASPLSQSNAPPSKTNLLEDELSQVPLALVEHEGRRKPFSILDLENIGSFLTIESPLYRSIEYFIKEASADITSEQLLSALGSNPEETFSLPVLCNLHSSSGYLGRRIKQIFEINSATVSQSLRSVKLQWSIKNKDMPIWFSDGGIISDIRRDDRKFFVTLSEARERFRATRRRNFDSFNFPLEGIQTIGFEGESMFVANGEIFFLPTAPLTEYMVELYASNDAESKQKLAVRFLLLDVIHSQGWAWESLTPELFQRALGSVSDTSLSYYMHDEFRFLEAIKNTSSNSFNAFAWDRRGDIFQL